MGDGSSQTNHPCHRQGIAVEVQMQMGQASGGALVQTIRQGTSLGEPTGRHDEGETVQGLVVRCGQQEGHIAGCRTGGVHKTHGEGVQHGGTGMQPTGPSTDLLCHGAPDEGQVEALQSHQRDGRRASIHVAAYQGHRCELCMDGCNVFEPEMPGSQ